MTRFGVRAILPRRLPDRRQAPFPLLGMGTSEPLWMGGSTPAGAGDDWEASDRLFEQGDELLHGG